MTNRLGRLLLVTLEAARPYTSNAGKTAHVRVKKVSQPDVTEIRS